VIASQAAAAAFRGQAPHLMQNHGTDISRIRSNALKEAIHSGDTVIDQIVRDAARYIGVAVANIVNLLAPDKIILGGGMVEALPDLFVAEVKKTAMARILPSFNHSFDVVAAELGDLASVLGAAAWAELSTDHGAQ
jgi:glucokinase